MTETGYDTYIVTFKDDTTDEEIERHIEQLVQDGGVVTHRYDTVFKGYAAQIPPAFLDMLENNLQDGDGIVDAIEPDGTVSAFPESTPTNGA